MFSIYIIRNNQNGKVYVGKTSHSVNSRFRAHIRASRRLRNRHLYKAASKYGWSAFSVETVRQTEDNLEANWLESLYIGVARSHLHAFGYNDTYGGEGVYGTPETRRKISDTKKNQHLHPTEETRAKLRLARIGRTPALGMKHTQKWKAQHSAQMLGKNHPLFGKHHSDETKAKIAAAAAKRRALRPGRGEGPAVFD